MRIGVIGCGKQAEKHIKSLKKIPGTELILADIDPKAAKRLSEQNRCTWSQDIKNILSDKAVKGVIICTPTSSHAYLIAESLKAGKHVFCEKPLCATLKEAEELAVLNRKYKWIVLVGYIYRYVPIFEKGYEIIRGYEIDGQSLALGKALSAFFRLGGRGGHQVWKHMKDSEGGAINEMLVHMIDLANWYFGPLSDPEVISCDIRLRERVIEGKKVKVDAEDFVLVRLRGKNGVEIFCQADLITPAFSQYIEVQGENGSFMGSIQQDMPSYLFLKEGRGGYQSGKSDLRHTWRNALDVQMLEYVKSLLTNEGPERNSIEDSISLMRIWNKIKDLQKD